MIEERKAARSFGSHITHYSSLITGFVFPPRCVVCRARGNWLCARCRPQLDLIRPPVCQRCGLPVERGSACEWCRHRRVAVDAQRVCGYFEGPLREAVHRLKFADERYLARPLAALMVDAWLSTPIPVDLLVPVPLGPARERERGYNQSALLAKEVGRILSLPVLERALARTRETPPQVGLPREQRLENLRGAFGANAAVVTGKRICLVDDVSTTGATLAACTSALRAAGATAVFGLVLAKTR